MPSWTLTKKLFAHVKAEFKKKFSLIKSTIFFYVLCWGSILVGNVTILYFISHFYFKMELNLKSKELLYYREHLKVLIVPKYYPKKKKNSSAPSDI